jgi:hypothetical protein
MIKVTIRRNIANPPAGKRLEIDPRKESFANFLEKCSSSIGIRGKRLYDSSGANITAMDELVPNDVYYLSEVIKNSFIQSIFANICDCINKIFYDNREGCPSKQ